MKQLKFHPTVYYKKEKKVFATIANYKCDVKRHQNWITAANCKY